MDEGYVHIFRKIRRCSTADELSLANVYRQGFFEPDLTVIVEANPDTIVARRHNRDGLVIDRKKSQEAVERMWLTYRDAEYLSHKNRRFRVCVVQNNMEGEADTENLLNVVSNYIDEK